MTSNLASSAPHIFPAAAWEHLDEQLVRDSQARISGLILYRDPAGALELGVRRWHPGTSHQTPLTTDELRYFMAGRGIFRAASEEVVEVTPGTAAHFKQGWAGEVEILETLDATYVRCEGGPGDRTPVLRDVLSAGPLKEWGPVSQPIEGNSTTAGILMSREPDMRAESGIWTCTPGIWRCELQSDEFCHFLEGSSTYTHDSGEVIEIRPDTLAYFPRGWKGRCAVHRTVRKVYMIR